MIPTFKNIFHYVCWLFCCLLFAFASCTNAEEKALQSNAVEDKDIKNYAVINGDSVYVADFNYTIIEDDLEIKVLEGYHGISHDGKYGYVIENADEFYDPKEVIKIVVKDLQTGKTIKSARLKDIIAKSQYSDALNEIALYQESDGRYRENPLSAGKYYFDYHNGCFGKIFPYSHGLVVGACWRHARSLTSSLSKTFDYSGAFFLFINHELELEKIATLGSQLYSTRIFIDGGDSIYFASSAWLNGIYNTNDASFKEIFPPEMAFDFNSFETLEQFSHSGIYGDSAVIKGVLYSLFHIQEPTAVIEQKSLYVYTYKNGHPIIKVYNPLNKEVAVFHSPSLNILLDNLNLNDSHRFCIEGLSKDFIFVTNCHHNCTLDFESKKQNIYAIPRKILDYAD